VTNTGLKVVVFSAICKRLVRVTEKGVSERQSTADSSQPTDEKEEKEKGNAETLRTPKLHREGRVEEQDAGSRKGRVPKWEAGSGWKPKFTVYVTAFLIPCQVISSIVMIRIVCAWRVS
jgi:hypothetical protein